MPPVIPCDGAVPDDGTDDDDDEAVAALASIEPATMPPATAPPASRATDAIQVFLMSFLSLCGTDRPRDGQGCRHVWAEGVGALAVACGLRGYPLSTSVSDSTSHSV